MPIAAFSRADLLHSRHTTSTGSADIDGCNSAAFEEERLLAADSGSGLFSDNWQVDLFNQHFQGSDLADRSSIAFGLGCFLQAVHVNGQGVRLDHRDCAANLFQREWL